ncbi:MAG: MarR family transcriptional regulator [Oscillospiraceae bacterium]|nr:MarR family transcriptional regulator [Oscillospiraceae bacterium]
MKLEWMGAYRDIVGDFYRSANGYSQICKTELFGEKVRFSPYEVQIMEHVLEYADEHRNMKWYAERLGLSQATYSKYVRKLVEKGLLEKYHTEGNRKDIILMVSPLGREEYARYAADMKETVFRELFDLLDSVSPEELEAVKKVFAVWGRWHRENREQPQPGPVSLVRVEPGSKK